MHLRVGLLAGLLLIGACSDDESASPEPSTAADETDRSGLAPASCLPAMPVASPSTVSAGSAVTVSSAGTSDCTVEPTEYRIVLGSVGRHQPVDLGLVDVASDGAFSTSVTIPPNITAGPAYLSVRGSSFDDCDNQASCASYGVTIEIAAATGSANIMDPILVEAVATCGANDGPIIEVSVTGGTQPTTVQYRLNGEVVASAPGPTSAPTSVDIYNLDVPYSPNGLPGEVELLDENGKVLAVDTDISRRTDGCLRG